MKYIPTTINLQSNKTVWVVDDFYTDPLAVRDFALKQKFSANPEYHKGIRTEEQFFVPGTRERFESIMDINITKWEDHGMNGRFQYCTAGYYDSTNFDLVDSIGNVFNRLFIFDAQSIHAASQYFGQSMTDSRLFQIFFFD